MEQCEAISAVHQGKMVECSAEDYHAGIRTALQDFAGKCIDHGDSVRAMIALQEVKRLDGLYPPMFLRPTP